MSHYDLLKLFEDPAFQRMLRPLTMHVPEKGEVCRVGRLVLVIR